MDDNIIELLAMELFDKTIPADYWKAAVDETKPSWHLLAEPNKDDYRRQAKISINFLWEKWF